MKNIYYIIVAVFLSVSTIFAQRVATHTITNFNVNTSTNKFSFDIYSQRTGAQSILVGLTSYYINYNNAALNTPVLSNVNPKYTTGSPTGDYDAMTVQIVLGKIAVSILVNATGDGTGSALSTTGPMGELICTVTLNITNQSATALASWDIINSTMLAFNPLFTVTNNYVGSFDNPLPVELSSFAAKMYDQDKVKLNWKTQTEVNNFGFDVERQATNGQWEKVGFVNGNGNSNSPKDYTYIDNNLIGGSKFLYRLKQVDNDGQFAYSDAVEVEVVPNEFDLSQNYPNPFNPTTTIKFSVPKQTQLKINIYNMLGELLQTVSEGIYEAGYYSVNVDASNLPSGMYIYRIESNEFVRTMKMMLLK